MGILKDTLAVLGLVGLATAVGKALEGESDRGLGLHLSDAFDPNASYPDFSELPELPELPAIPDFPELALGEWPNMELRAPRPPRAPIAPRLRLPEFAREPLRIPGGFTVRETRVIIERTNEQVVLREVPAPVPVPAPAPEPEPLDPQHHLERKVEV